MEASKPRVCVYRDHYLRTSETFIHRQLTGLTRYRPFALARRAMNAERFPLEAGTLRTQWRWVTLLDNLISRTPIGKFATRSFATAFIVRQLRSLKPQLLHVHFGTMTPHCMRAARLTNTPLVVTFHGFDATRMLQGKTFEERYPGLADQAAAFIAISDHIETKLVEAGAPHEKIIRHYIGVPIPELNTYNADSNLALQVSRLVEKKGIDTTLEGFARAHDKNPELQLVIIGDGPLRRRLIQQAADLGIAGAVTFLGDQPNEVVSDWLKKAFVFVHPSKTASDGDQEGLGIAILEAMTLSLPVIATRSGGIPEIVSSSNGYLIDEDDSLALADALIELDANRNLARSKGEAGRRLAENDFDMSRNTAGLEDIYDRVATPTSAHVTTR